MIEGLKEIIKAIKMNHCKHDWEFTKYLHGDEINLHNGYRFEYKCTKCGKFIWRKYAMDCSKCKHIYDDNIGQYHCDMEPADMVCMANHRYYWEEACMQNENP